MKVQVLVAAMGQKDHSLLDRMNIQSDVIVGNQCDYDSVARFEWKGHRAIYLSFAERGVGLNRNNALMRADGDVCLFADDDMRYCDDYPDIVSDAFKNCPKADVIVFNLYESEVKRYVNQKVRRVHVWNFLRYGTARFAVKTDQIRKHGIFFNQCFGGGTEHCHGEDNIFLAECLKKGLKVYAVPAYIAELTEERASSWNNGYGDKYLRDQGVLYRTMFPRCWKLFCLQDSIRRMQEYGISPRKSYKIMTKNKI